MFIAALFTIVKIWKQPKCSLIHECMKKIWYGILLSHKKKGVVPLAITWMDLEGIILSGIIY